MPQRKYTLQLGKTRGGITEAAGTVISGGNAIEVNIDYDGKMTQSDVLRCLDQVRQQIISTKWPPA